MLQPLRECTRFFTNAKRCCLCKFTLLNVAMQLSSQTVVRIMLQSFRVTAVSICCSNGHVGHGYGWGCIVQYITRWMAAYRVATGLNSSLVGLPGIKCGCVVVVHQSVSQGLSWRLKQFRLWRSEGCRDVSLVNVTCCGWLHLLTWLSLSQFAEPKFGLNTYFSQKLSELIIKTF